MKPPIIADNRGDVLVFETVEKAERYLEPIDVKNNEYEIYDAGGWRLTASVIRDSRGRERVRLSLNQPPIQDQDKLRTILLEYLSAVMNPKEAIDNCSFEQLVEYGLKFKTE